MLWIRNNFFWIRIRLFRKFRIRIRFQIWPNLSVRRQFFLCLRFLDRPGLIFNAINLKILQLIGLIVVYNLWKFQIDGLQIEVRTSLSDPDPKLIIPDPDSANNFGSDRIRIHNTDWKCVKPLFLKYFFLIYTTLRYIVKVGTDRIRIRWKFFGSGSGSDQKGPNPTGSGSGNLENTTVIFLIKDCYFFRLW